jgi:iron complex transport system substrate-binding protein
MRRRFVLLSAALAVVFGFVLAACGDTATPTATRTQAPAATSTPTTAPTATLTPTPKVNPFVGVPGIVDPNNLSWPREVEGLNGRVKINAKPARIVALSVGHDEMTLAIVPAARLVGVSSSTKSALYSNVADLVKDTQEISREPETILSVRPDIMVTSAFFPTESVEALQRAGLTVLQTDLKNDPTGRKNNILLMGYIYGEEDRAVAFANEIEARNNQLQSVVAAKPNKPKVLSLASYADQIYTAGTLSTEGGIIESAGGVNSAATAGLEGNPVISLESIVSMGPDVIIITQPADSGDPFKEQLLNHSALAQVPAVRNRQVYVVDPKYYTTLSHWNLRGAEDLATILWPQDFANKNFGGFSTP